MSPENQAENTPSSADKPAKTAPPKTFNPRASVIQIHPEGERIHPKKAEGPVCQTSYRRRIGDPICILRNSMV